MRMLACPVCGRYPRVTEFHWDYKVQCRPLFGKPHLIVFADTPMDGVREWNRAVMDYADENRLFERGDD